jgi:hypothetical protein
MLLLSLEGGARQVSESVALSFKSKLGPETFHIFDCKKYLSSFLLILKKNDETMAVDLLNQSLIVQCLQYSITHLFVPALCPVTLFTLNLLKNLNIMRIHWFFEDYRRAYYWKDVIAGYSWFFAIQKEPIKHLCEVNRCQYRYLPTAASDTVIAFSSQKKKYEKNTDVSFIGIPSEYRISFLEFLAQNGISLSIAGKGWGNYCGLLSRYIIENSWIDSIKMVEIVNHSRIALNLSVKNPNEEILSAQLSPRIFDVLTSNSILLTEDVPLLFETINNCYFHTFKNKENALTEIVSILQNYSFEKLHKKFTENHKIICTNHTWNNRIDKILSITA